MFDAIDYQARYWLKLSGWPIGGGDLERYVPRAGALLGLPNLSVHHALRDLGQPFDGPLKDADAQRKVVDLL